MGLDMYLSKRTYVKRWSHQPKEDQHTVSVKLGGKSRKDIKPRRITYVVEEAMYWRKANAIHSWFVTNCQDGIDECQEVSVSRRQLEELASTCEEVVYFKDSSLLQPIGGFFFGGTEVDEYYFNECEETAKELRKILEEPVPEGCYSGEYTYQSSW